ncbi:PIN domain-containing protein [Rothia halotolerans]|uniref:PIN domain-containing protein n=1 Tax=Rothia halotolerans TaxID=405770 RepID=UPI00101C0025|nr:PIN domain-containing protein [Rothia halotolerans]
MSFPVLLDACALIPMPVADMLLRLTTAKQYRALWSEEILEEVERNLVSQLGRTAQQARRRVDRMREYFPDALVEGHEGLSQAMTNDPKDRHVLAAAVRANAELIVTFNLKDFPPAALDPYEIEARSPDDFLLDQLDLNASAVLAVAREVIEDMRRPRIGWTEYVQGLSASGLPLFAGALDDAFRRT